MTAHSLCLSRSPPQSTEGPCECLGVHSPGSREGRTLISTAAWGQGGCTESCPPLPGPRCLESPASSSAQPQGPQPGFSPLGSITHGLNLWTVMSQRWAPTQHSALTVSDHSPDPWRSCWGLLNDRQDRRAPSCPGTAHRLLKEDCPSPASARLSVTHMTGLLSESASTKKYWLFIFSVAAGDGGSCSEGVLPHPQR